MQGLGVPALKNITCNIIGPPHKQFRIHNSTSKFSSNCRLYSTVLFTIEKYPYISGPV